MSPDTGALNKPLEISLHTAEGIVTDNKQEE
jgi:hypothetical protein